MLLLFFACRMEGLPFGTPVCELVRKSAFLAKTKACPSERQQTEPSLLIAWLMDGEEAGGLSHSIISRRMRTA